MWIRTWMAVCVTSTVLTQRTHTRVQQDGGSFEWGWHLMHPGEDTLSPGQSYNSAQNVAEQQNVQVYNTTEPLHQSEGLLQTNTAQPEQLYFLQQQFSSPAIEQQILSTPSPTNVIHYTSVPNYHENFFNRPVQYTIYHQNKENYKINHQIDNNESRSNENIQDSKPLQLEKAGIEYTNENISTASVVRVFKDTNCSIEELKQNAPEHVSYDQKNQEFSDFPSYNIYDINEKFAAATERPLTYSEALHFRVENPRINARSERYYYATEITTAVSPYSDNLVEDQFSKLVASTQDLISNEDLLRINHAAERQIAPSNDDIIKPRPRFGLKTDQTGYDHYTTHPTTPRSIVTVKSKIGTLVNSGIEHAENNKSKEKVLQTNSNEYKFATPIVVQDSPYTEYKEQIVNNLISTMVPYMEDGYEIIGVKNTLEENNTYYLNQNKDSLNVTPRPLGQKYLAPITVALRLINANDTDILNNIEDHEASDSEIITDTVKSPDKEKTVVEVLQSIPLEITHINDVEVHEYLEEGRSNNKGPMDVAKRLYNKYMAALKSSQQFPKNVNALFSKYGTEEKLPYSNYNETHYDNPDSRENLEPSENIQTEVEVRPNNANQGNERTEYVRDSYDYGFNNQGVIQPIVIEKEVPITKFVDRFIERQVPYPEPVEVLKEVPVDRPYAVPVPYEKIVEKPIEVTKYVDKPYPVEVPRPYPVEVKVPYPVEHKVYVDRPVHVPYQIEKFIERQIIQPVAVPTPVAYPVEVRVPYEQQVLYPVPIETRVPFPVEVEKPVPVEKIVHKEVPVPYAVEKKVPYPVPYETKIPVPYPVEKRIPVPVEKIVEKPVTVTKVVEKPIRVEVPVPHPVPVAVHVPQPYPVDRIVEKRVPYPVTVDRFIEKKVPVKVPYAVEKIVEKIVEKPVVVTKYVDKPYPVEKRVPYPVEKIIEKKVPYPVQVKVPYPVEKIVEKTNYVHIRVPYNAESHQNHNGYALNSQQTVNIPQYQKYVPEQYKQGIQQQSNPGNQNQLSQAQYAAEYYQYLNDKLRRPQSIQQPVQTTHWGNLYASSYQYINKTDDYKQGSQQFKKTPALQTYINYLTNSQSPYQYYGPPPLQTSNNLWDENLVQLKLRRTDRTPRVANLQIEYGFKPPLIPSTEVDLDGIPVHNNERLS